MNKLFNTIKNNPQADFLAFKLVNIEKGDNLTTDTFVFVSFKNETVKIKVLDNEMIKGMRKGSKVLLKLSINEFDNQLCVEKAAKIKGGFVSVIAETML